MVLEEVHNSAVVAVGHISLLEAEVRRIVADMCSGPELEDLSVAGERGNFASVDLLAEVVEVYMQMPWKRLIKDGPGELRLEKEGMFVVAVVVVS